MSVRRSVFGGLAVLCVLASLLAAGVAGAATPPPNDSFSNAQVLSDQRYVDRERNNDGATARPVSRTMAASRVTRPFGIGTPPRGPRRPTSGVPRSDGGLPGAVAVYRGTAVGRLRQWPRRTPHDDCCRPGASAGPVRRHGRRDLLDRRLDHDRETPLGGFHVSWSGRRPPTSERRVRRCPAVSTRPAGKVRARRPTQPWSRPNGPTAKHRCGTDSPHRSGCARHVDERIHRTGPYDGPPLTTLYRGTSLASLSTGWATSLTTPGGIYPSVTAGTTYYISVGPHFSKFDGVIPGPFELSWDFSPTRRARRTPSRCWTPESERVVSPRSR